MASRTTYQKLINRYIIIAMLVLCWDVVQAQKSPKYILSVMPPMPHGTPLYFLDNKEVTVKALTKIKSDDIASMEIMQPPASVELYKNKGKNGVVMLVSNKAAFLDYSLKFFSFSAGYHEYLNKYGDDSRITYIVDGVTLRNENAAGSLYSLERQKIKAVEFYNGQTKDAAIVKITTIK